MANYLRRSLVLILGLFILAVGIGFSVSANLGVSPVSCLPYVVSLWQPISMGTVSMLMQGVFLLIQILILRREFKPFQLLQLGVLLIFGLFTDLGVAITAGIQPQSYLGQWLCLLVSLPVIALGVALEVKAGLLVLPMEGMVSAIAAKTGRPFGQIKVWVDSALVVIAAALSLAVFGQLRGVREGTVIAAIVIGYIVKWISPRLGFLDGFLGIEAKEAA